MLPVSRCVDFARAWPSDSCVEGAVDASSLDKLDQHAYVRYPVCCRATPPQDVLWWTLAKLEPWIQNTRLRKAALAEVMRHVHFEVCL